MANGLKVQALINWLVSGAPPQTDYDETVAEFARRLVDAGVQADIVGLYQKPKNPLVGGKRFLWSPDKGIRVREYSHAEMQAAYFLGGVVETAQRESRPIRYRIGEMPRFDGHPGSAGIIESGFSEYIAFPLIAVNETSAALAVGVKREGGLAEEQFDICRRVAAPLARVVESRVRYEGNATLLATFLGRDAGARVNAGMVRRGDAEMIRAVLVFTDMEKFTEQSNSLPISETVDLLNRYFEALERPILDNGGDVLKLIGDGMRAIFRTPDDFTAEQGAALSAVGNARAALVGSGIAFRAAFHIGEVHYGNIGGLTRLDFTAIGPTVNLAARLLGAASQMNVDAVCSAAFSRLLPGGT